MEIARRDARLHAFHMIEVVQTEEAPTPEELERRLDQADAEGWPEVARVLLYALAVQASMAGNQHCGPAGARMLERCASDGEPAMLATALAFRAGYLLAVDQIDRSDDAMARAVTLLDGTDGPAMELATALVQCALVYRGPAGPGTPSAGRCCWRGWRPRGSRTSPASPGSRARCPRSTRAATRRRLAARRELGTKDPLAMLTIDLDHFKPVNDRHGHAAGDEVLRCAGRILAGQIRATDLAVRVGGDEFLVVLEAASEAVAQGRAARIATAIRDERWLGIDPDLRVTASVGVAAGTGEDPEALAEAADAAMYRAKAAGRDRAEA